MMRLSPWMKFLPYALVLLAYWAGLWVDIMEIDAAQYAVMSRDMLQAGDLLHLMDRGRDYLDKPPLIFWLTALSYKLFGVSTFSYKLPSLLFSLLGIWSTKKLAEIHYGPDKAFLSALVLASAQGFFLMNNDVKTDMYLIGAMTFSLWQLAAYLEAPRWDRLLGAFLGIGLAMLAKGPLGLVAPALALGAHLLLGRDWRNILRWQWLVGLLVVALSLLPFCIGLYEQFGERGVRFFLWTQSFGRVTGESEWTNDASPFFLVHTFAWAFLPWTLLAVAAWGRQLWRLARNRMRVRRAGEGFSPGAIPEGISLAGFTLLFIAFSLSRFKLPHYIFIVFPFAAIMAGDLLGDFVRDPALRRWSRIFQGIHIGFFTLGGVAISGLVFWAFPGSPWWLLVLLIGGLAGIAGGLIRSRNLLWKHLLPTAVGFAFFNLILNAYLYPSLLAYQSTAQAGRYVSNSDLPLDRVFALESGGRAMDFYSGRVLEQAPSPHLWAERDFLDQPAWIYLDGKGLEEIERAGYSPVTVRQFQDFRVARLSLKFLNPATRPDAVRERFLLRVGPE